MMIKSLISAAAGLIGLASGATAAATVFHTGDDAVLEQFSHAVAGYYALHQDVQWRVMPLHVTDDPEEIFAGSRALADGIRLARADARRGDLFTDEVSAVFRKRIHETLITRHLDDAALLFELMREAPRPLGDTLTVNGSFDWRFGALMPAALIKALPALPPALQYRFVDRSLVLIDIDADLVVDILPDALAD